MPQKPGHVAGKMLWMVPRYAELEGTLIRLGSILSDPENLESSLNLNAIPAIPPKVGSVSTVSSATNVAPGTPPVPEGVAFQGRLAHKRRGRETRGRSGSPTDNTDKVRTRKDWRVRDTVLPKSPQAKAELGPAYSEPAGLSLQPPSSDSDSRHLGHSEPVDLIEL